MRSARILSLVVILSLGAGLWGVAAEDDGLLRIHLLWTNDLHGHIAPEPARFMNPEFPPPLGGSASAAPRFPRS